MERTDSGCVLTFRNDEVGDPLVVHRVKHSIDGHMYDQTLGTLQPGETYTTELNDVSGVYAVCADGQHTNVSCLVHERGAA